MSNREEWIKEVCELLKVWFHLRNSEWPDAKLAIEERVAALMRDAPGGAMKRCE